MKTLILLACLLQLGSTCTCYRPRGSNPYESEPRASILEVKIKRVTKQPTASKNPYQISSPWANPGYNYRAVIEVSAVVKRVHRNAGRNFSVGNTIKLSSKMSDAQCGVGGFLRVGETLIFRTYKKRSKFLQLCEYLEFNLDRLRSRG